MVLDDLLKEADSLKLKGQHDEAIKLANRMILMDPAFAEAYEEVGDNYLSLRDYERATKALMYALKLRPKSPNGLYLMGFLHSAQGEFTQSVQTLEEANKVQPHHPEILRCLGWSIFHNGDRDRGLMLLERARAMAPKDTLILCDLAVCYLNTKAFDRTIELLQEALTIDPANEKAKDCMETAKFFKREFQKLKESK